MTWLCSLCVCVHPCVQLQETASEVLKVFGPNVSADGLHQRHKAIQLEDWVRLCTLSLLYSVKLTSKSGPHPAVRVRVSLLCVAVRLTR